jgi:hypothetical protein
MKRSELAFLIDCLFNDERVNETQSRFILPAHKRSDNPVLMLQFARGQFEEWTNLAHSVDAAQTVVAWRSQDKDHFGDDCRIGRKSNQLVFGLSEQRRGSGRICNIFRSFGANEESQKYIGINDYRSHR